MATVGKTKFTLNKLLTHAMRRAGIPAQEITSELLQTGKECLTLTFGSLQNEKMPLWCQERVMLPIYQGEEQIVMPEGTIDILKDGAFYRQLPRVGDSYNTSNGGTAVNVGDGDLQTSCTQIAINGFISAQFLAETAVTVVGFMPNGDQFYNLAFDASDDGVSWTNVQVIDPPDGDAATAYQNKKWAWYEVLSPATALFFRIRETSGGTLNIRELVLSSQPNDILIYRMNRSQYLLQPNKKVQGQGTRILQFWLDRTLDQPTLYCWPCPGPLDTFNCLYVWRQRYIADIGNFNEEVELPVRWYDGICWKLAYYCAVEMPQVAKTSPGDLLASSQVPWANAISEERDRSPIFLRPNIRRYTR